jgi:hypothetical protein
MLRKNTRKLASCALAVAAAIIVALILIPGSASAGVAVPNTSGPTCTVQDTPWPCAQVYGNGLTIVQMNGWAHNNTDLNIADLHIELYFNNHSHKIKDCPAFNLSAGANSPNCIWAPNHNEAAGNYCTTVWENVDGTYFDVGDACVGVHGP